MGTENRNSCDCGAVPKLVFPCWGASDVGELSDLAARKMTREGTGKMYCPADIKNVSRVAEKGAKLLKGRTSCC